MKEKYLNFIVETLSLIAKGYPVGSDAQKELLNNIDMLTSKCYRTIFSNSREVCYAV